MDGIPVYRLRKSRTAGKYRRTTTAASTLSTAPRPYFMNNEPDAIAIIVPDHAFAIFVRRIEATVTLRQLQPKPHEVAVPSATITALVPVIALVYTR
jgi:hypothetical protein